MPSVGCGSTQEDARRLYRDEVWPDLVERHTVSRADRKSAAAATYNAIAAPAAEKALVQAFGAKDGAKLEAQSLSKHARAVSEALGKVAAYEGRRDLSRLSPWLASYSADTGEAAGAHMVVFLARLAAQSSAQQCWRKLGGQSGVSPMHAKAQPFSVLEMCCE